VIRVALAAALVAACAAHGTPPCDAATYAAIMAECSVKVRACDGRSGACPELDECEMRLRDREATCLR
jgi:hypothetical protein